MAESFAKKLAWKQFHLIFCANCAWARTPQRSTDYCDHCHFLQSSIEPGLTIVLKEAEAQLIAQHAEYFNGFFKPESSDRLSHAKSFLQHVDGHAESNRALRQRRLNLATRLSLHELEAKISHQLRWEIKVADAYNWHKASADRQTCWTFATRIDMCRF